MDARVDERTDLSAKLESDRSSARLRWLLMGGGIALALVAGLWYYLATGRYVSTDDSSIRAAQATISANVPGRVIELDVHDNQSVRRGDVLFRLDDRPFRIAVEEAQAKLAAARMQISAAKATYRHQLAELAAARDTLAYQQTEFQRQQRLLQSGISSRAQFEQSQHAVQLAQSQLNSAQQQVGSVLALLGGNPDLPLEQHPVVMQAQAALDRANLDLSYTVIRAPDDGVVAKVEQLQVGRLHQRGNAGVQPGLEPRRLGRGQLQGRRADLHARRPVGRSQHRCLSGPALQGAGGEPEPGHRRPVLAAAAGKCHRQLGQGGAARAGATAARCQRVRAASCRCMRA